MTAPFSPNAAALIATANEVQVAFDVIDDGMADLAFIREGEARFVAFGKRLASGEWIDPVEKDRTVEDYRAFKVRRQQIRDRWRDRADQGERSRP